MSSRVIVKNLPKHATEQRLRKHFAALGEVTDCRIKLTKEGRSRQFAFVGFRHASEADEVIKQLNNSYFDTARISVEAAHAPGSEGLARPWSRYASGSSAYQRKHPDLREDAKDPSKDAKAGAGHPRNGRLSAKPRAAGDAPGRRQAARGEPAAPPPVQGATVTTADVRPGKAGVGSQRVHVAFDSDSDGDEDAPVPSSAVPADGKDARPAFDEELDDLAYLQNKSKGTCSSGMLAGAEEPEGAAVGGEAPGKTQGARRKKKRRLRTGKVSKGAAAASDTDGAAGPDAAGGADAAAGVDTTGANAGGGAAVGGPAPAPAAVVEDEDEDGEEDAAATGRLYVTNLPYGATDDELRAHFEPLGELASVHICKDENTLKSRGIGYITYVFPECAVRARGELDLKSFQGRLLRIAPARSRPAAPDATAVLGGATSSYKRKKEEKQKKVDAHLEHTWNLLYVSANAATDASALQLGIAKSDILGKDAQNAAVASALTETSIIQQTKRWLQQEGIHVDAFERSGSSLVKSQIVGDGKRREDTFIVKHLPAGASHPELRERFAKYGELVRCSLAPSGTVAIIQYMDKAHARRAFQKSAFARYRHVPLYLEWAPDDVFNGTPAPAEGDAAEGAQGSATSSKIGKQVDDEEAEDADEESKGCLFVKNLNFSTTDAGLKAAFSSCKGFRSALVMTKKAALKKDAPPGSTAKTLSMGYGFLEFATAAQAEEVLRRRQGAVIDGHSVQLQVSQARNRQRIQNDNASSKKPKGALTTQRLCVRNLAFEATKKEIRQLFEAYGSVTSVRIPRKGDYSGHRGFAFVDLASKSEAAAAYEALQHTHLYGRRLVIEPAEEKENTVETAHLAAQKRVMSHEHQSEAKKRHRAGILRASGESGSFEDAML